MERLLGETPQTAKYTEREHMPGGASPTSRNN